MPHYPEGSTITREDGLTRIVYPRGKRVTATINPRPVVPCMAGKVNNEHNQTT